MASARDRALHTGPQVFCPAMFSCDCKSKNQNHIPVESSDFELCGPDTLQSSQRSTEFVDHLSAAPRAGSERSEHEELDGAQVYLRLSGKTPLHLGLSCGLWMLRCVVCMNSKRKLKTAAEAANEYKGTSPLL